MLFHDSVIILIRAHVKPLNMPKKKQLKLSFHFNNNLIKTKIYNGRRSLACFVRVIFVQEIIGLDTNWLA